MQKALRAVRQQIKAGVPLEHIEAYIDELSIDREVKAVLWLVAWAGEEPSVVARELGACVV